MNEDTCTHEEQGRRLETCRRCDRFEVAMPGMTRCTECRCSISLLITFQRQACPLGKW
jgi:hypothetical protein